MNQAAQRLGMTQSHYVNPNGLPADEQIVSARDLAILARAAIREFPEYDYYWHLPGIRMGKRVYRNYNTLIGRYPGADGMKTGFICASGFNLVATATRDGKRLIAVVLGAPSGAARAVKAAQLLERGFAANPLAWLTPSLGTVDALVPVNADPPNLREEMCGGHRKRPASEEEEDPALASTAAGSSAYAVFLSNLRPAASKSAALLQDVKLGEPVVVFTGPVKKQATPATEVAAVDPKAAKPGTKAAATGVAKPAPRPLPFRGRASARRVLPPTHPPISPPCSTRPALTTPCRCRARGQDRDPAHVASTGAGCRGRGPKPPQEPARPEHAEAMTAAGATRLQGPAEPIPLTVLTGFLGAGKTSLLNRLVRDPALADTAVIINEFGEIGLDHLLVKSIDDNMVLLQSGCLCCTLRGDLVTALENLLRDLDNGRISFRRVILETTGLADPAPVLQTAMAHPYLVMRYRLDGVITVVDAVNGAATLDAHMESVKQVAVADRIVLTKTDLIDTPERRRGKEQLLARLHALNPAAVILDAAANEATAEQLLACGLFDPDRKIPDVKRWLAEEAYADAARGDHGHHHDHHHDPNRHDERIRAFTLATETPIPGATFEMFIDLVRSLHGPKLLRLKGIVKLAETPGRAARDPRRAARHASAGAARTLARRRSSAPASS